MFLETSSEVSSLSVASALRLLVGRERERRGGEGRGGRVEEDEGMNRVLSKNMIEKGRNNSNKKR